LAWILTALIVVLLAVVAFLIAGMPLLDEAPRSDVERDYRLLLQAYRDDPTNPEVLMTLAEAEYELGKRSDAIERAEGAVKLAKNQTDYRLRFAALLVRSGDLEEARRMLEAEIELVGSDNAEPYFLLAQVLNGQGKTEEGLSMMEKALDLQPMAADMRASYAAMLEEAGKKKQAVEQYKSALRYLPGDQTIVEALERLGVEVDPTESSDPHGGVAPQEGSAL
jgi:tetratricopeptide (TPR) repeat protein